MARRRWDFVLTVSDGKVLPGWCGDEPALMYDAGLLLSRGRIDPTPVSVSCGFVRRNDTTSECHLRRALLCRVLLPGRLAKLNGRHMSHRLLLPSWCEQAAGVPVSGLRDDRSEHRTVLHSDVIIDHVRICVAVRDDAADANNSRISFFGCFEHNIGVRVYGGDTLSDCNAATIFVRVSHRGLHDADLAHFK